jgi:hypothetical protein
MNQVTGFCSIKSPIYSVNTNKFCITALYMKNAELIVIPSFPDMSEIEKFQYPSDKYSSNGNIVFILTDI